MVCLMVLVYLRARKYDWPVDTQAQRQCLVTPRGRRRADGDPDRYPGRLLPRHLHRDRGRRRGGGLRLRGGSFYYKNVSYREMAKLAYDSAILTASVVFLLAVASVFQYLMGVSGVPQLLARCLGR